MTFNGSLATERHVKRGWFRPRLILQVRDTPFLPWRNATERDIELRDQRSFQAFRRRHQPDYTVPVGTRVKIKKTAGFSAGAEGTVAFQEPCGGIVWVVRDRAGSPCYFFLDELIIEGESPFAEFYCDRISNRHDRDSISNRRCRFDDE